MSLRHLAIGFAACLALGFTGTHARAASPASLVAGAVSPSISADGMTAIIATLKNADGSLYSAQPATVTFTSTCAAAKTAQLDASVASDGGMAFSVYQPSGCTGTDTVVVTSGTLKTTVVLQIGAAKALSPKAALGRAMFFDPGLSASGKIACASCHNPGTAFLDPGPRPTPLGGVNGTAIGFRTAPSAAYAFAVPPFAFLTDTNKAGTANNGANGKLGTPRRGLMWDGRASTVFDQAKGPFTGPHEMANANSAAVLAKLLTRPYLVNYRTIFGTVSSTSNPDTVLTNMANAIGQFETEEKLFGLYNSKFDAVAKGQAKFTAQEANGQALFFNPAKAACAGCHNSDSQLKTTQGPQMFTDLSYRAIGVPRNWQLPYNNDTQALAALQSLGLAALANGATRGTPNHVYYDLGFCGPFRTDSLTDTTLCGAFRVPSLRNVAIKRSYFHNGVFNALPQVINFYMTRDAAPQQIYTKADRSPDIAFNDLPVIYRANIEQRPPFTPLKTGPRLTPPELQDLVTFLCTLTDGFDPAHPEAYRLPQQCRAAIRP